MGVDLAKGKLNGSKSLYRLILLKLSYSKLIKEYVINIIAYPNIRILSRVMLKCIFKE